MADGPRLLQLVLTNCDMCPLRRYVAAPAYADEDSGWDCDHELGHFRIADEGTYQDVIDFRASVVLRIKQNFPEQCPLGYREPESQERTRVVDLGDGPGYDRPPITEQTR